MSSKKFEDVLQTIRLTYPDYVITLLEFESFDVVGVRVSTLENVVSVIKTSDSSLEEVLTEAIMRIKCKERGCEFKSHEKEIEKATDVLKIALQEIGFDRAVSLLEKLNSIN